jgi:hypothetical protein
LQLGALRDALIDAGASPETANRAAEELAGHDREFGNPRADMNQEFAKVRADMNQEFAKVHGDINLLRWMIGVNSALTLAVLIKSFFH